MLRTQSATAGRGFACDRWMQCPLRVPPAEDRMRDKRDWCAGRISRRFASLKSGVWCAALGILGIAGTIAPASAGATVVTFDCITGSSSANCLAGESQLEVDVAAASGGVNFVFTNTGSSASSLTDVYFDDGSLLALASITNGPGVDFSALANPRNLPGANNI